LAAGGRAAAAGSRGRRGAFVEPAEAGRFAHFDFPIRLAQDAATRLDQARGQRRRPVMPMAQGRKLSPGLARSSPEGHFACHKLHHNQNV